MMAANIYKRELDAVSVEMWLQELRMECYRRNLEEYPNLKYLIELKDVDLKKLGITNAKDRATMMGSLDKYRSNNKSSGVSSSVRNRSQSEIPLGALLKKGTSIRKLKGLLGGGSSGNIQKKSKKTHEVNITSPQLSYEDGSEEVTLQPIPEVKTQGDDLTHNLPNCQHRISSSMEDLLQRVVDKRCAVENDYVPDPQGSPQLGYHHQQLQRSYTVSEPHPSYYHDSSSHPQLTDFDVFSSSLPRTREGFHPLSPRMGSLTPEYSLDDSIDHPNKHLSIVSMESGLGLTCDSDEKDDFNPTLPLEQQPWYHGPMGRGEAEALLDENGDFLVHENTYSEGSYTLSLIWEGRCYHLLINCNEIVMKGPRGSMIICYKYQFDNGAFDSVPELIYNHLRYRIPISREFDGILINPVCRIGTRGLNPLSYAPETPETPRRLYGTLPKNFGRSIDSNLENATRSPEFNTLGHNKRASIISLRETRSASFSPVNSPRPSPSRDFPEYTGMRTSSSSTNLLLARNIEDEDEASDHVLASIYRDVPESPNTARKLNLDEQELPEEVRPRTISPYSTYDVPTSARRRAMNNFSPPVSQTTPQPRSTRHKGPFDPDDYEVMEGASVRNTLPSSPKLDHRTPLSQQYSKSSSTASSHYTTVIPKSLRHEQHSSNSGVKYAEISFKKAFSSTGFSSRNDIKIRNRAQSVTYVTPRLIREEIAAAQDRSSPHPFSNLSQQTRNSPPTSSRTSPPVGLCPPKPIRDKTGPSRSSSGSPYSSRPASVMGRNVKSPQTIAEVPGFLKEFTNEELAMHLTKADAVCFLLAPRPGEDFDLWKNRVQEVSTDSGVFIGLQILASQAGEKLWKKLFFRHLSLSQLVPISLVHINDLVDRSKMLKRWIEMASLLQSGTYGNLFSFMAIMKGLESPQVIDMAKTWDLLKKHYSDSYNMYENQLKGMISALSEGAGVYAIEQLTIPAIQHLRKLYANDSQLKSQDLRIILEDFTSRTVGLDGLHSIIAHTSDLCRNAKRRLTVYSYDALLFDFFMQDIARTHLQNMGTSDDDPLERYRRFNIVLDALMSKLDNP